MSRREITFLAEEHKQFAIPFEAPDYFEFRADRPMHLLQKTCLWILRKLKAFRTGKTTHDYFESITFDSDDFLHRLFEQEEYITRQFNRKANTLLIGARDFDRLMGEMHSRHQGFAFNAELHYSDCGRREIHGLTVRVIPWLEGMIVVD